MKTASLVYITTFALLGACSNKPQSHFNPQNKMVLGLSTQTLEAPRPAEAATSAGSTVAVVSEVTLAKKEILGREFLYGADLQYSALGDKDVDVTLQSLANGHDIAHFQVVGKLLQLVADNTAHFESDVNHPERLIHEFPIAAESADTLTIVIDQASPILTTILTDKKAPAVRSNWVRSVKYVAEGNYLMWESSIEDGVGNVAEFMESLFPRDTLVPKDYKVLFNDDSIEPLAERFRFLSQDDKVFLDVPDQGRTQTKVANRFIIPKDKTIDWYVTPNIPDEYLPQVKMGVEGWNRYSQKMWGRDMIAFKGRLPAEIRIGDPRFNVVNWDKVADAGAAYESQASDPKTGIQSHSLIYLPFAWINIGKEYWKNGQFSDKADQAVEKIQATINSRSYMGRQLKVDCLDDPRMHLALKARQSPDDFSKELLRGTLFHEVGHSWGLAHNFKGSLAITPDAHADQFSTSIMDYNQYNVERAAFESLDSAKGPLLEYDRQIISVLYNDGRDVKDSDPVLPTCADEEADSLKGGIDPLCIRYDAGQDPTKQMEATIKLLTDADATTFGEVSLASSLLSVTDSLPDPATVTKIEDAAATAKSVAAQAAGLVNFYFGSGANSLNYMVRANIPALYIYKDSVLPQTYDEMAMRKRVVDGVHYVASLETLPKASADALVTLSQKLTVWLKNTQAVQGLPGETRDAKVTDLVAPLNAVKGKVEDPSENGLLTKVRARVLGSLKRVATSPFFFINSGSDGPLDLEAVALDVLEKGIVSPVGGQTKAQTRSATERLALVEALKTFKDVDPGKATVARVNEQFEKELGSAPNAKSRENLRTLIKSLAQDPPKPAEDKK